MEIRMAYSLYKREFRTARSLGDYRESDKTILVDVPDDEAKKLRPRWHYTYFWQDGRGCRWLQHGFVNAHNMLDAEKAIKKRGIEQFDLDTQPDYCGRNSRR